MGVLKTGAGRFFLFTVCGICGLLFCADNIIPPNTFQRIDDFKLRVIGVVVSPSPEVAPGDTVFVTAHFGGNQVTAVTGISLCFTMVGGFDGVVPGSVEKLDLLSPPKEMPDSARFSFIVKRDIFIGRQGYYPMVQSTSDSISRILMGPKDSVAASIAALSDPEKIALGAMVDKMALPVLLLFTARSVNGSVLTSATRIMIRYFPPLPGISPPNRNPDITWAGVCKVPDAYAMGFSPFDSASAGKYTMTYLFNKDHSDLCDSVVVVDTGFAYFLAADNGVSRRVDSASASGFDTSRESINDGDGSRIYELYRYHWFYQNVDLVSDDAKMMMEIENGALACIEMKPPLEPDMKRFRAWVAVTDEMGGRLLRPKGVCVRPVHGEFKFTDAYKEWASKRRTSSY
jgi:hypothetical protein